MESIRYQLKYCEGCGTLKLRSVPSATNYCRICEDILTRFRFPWHARTRTAFDRTGIVAQSPAPEVSVSPSSATAGRTQ